MSKHLSRRKRQQQKRKRSRSALATFHEEQHLIQILNDNHTLLRAQIRSISDRLRWFYRYRGTCINLMSTRDVILQVVNGITENTILQRFIGATVEKCAIRAEQGLSTAGWDGNIYNTVYNKVSIEVLISEINEEYRGMSSTIINTYGKLIESIVQWKRVKVLNTELTEEIIGRRSVRSTPWEASINIFNQDVVYVPLLLQQMGNRLGHWVLISVLPQSHTIKYYDSGNLSVTEQLRDRILNKIRTFLIARESSMRSQQYWEGKDSSSSQSPCTWTIDYPTCSTQQGDNCGWYVLYHLKLLALGLGNVSEVTDINIQAFQSLVFYEIIHCALFPLPTPSTVDISLFRNPLFPKVADFPSL